MKNPDNIIKYIASCNESGRKREIFLEIEEDLESGKVYNKIKVAWAILASTNKMPEYKIEESYKNLQAKINFHPSSFRFKVMPFLKYAAILILFLGSLPLLFYVKNQSANNTELKFTTIVAKYKERSQVILPDSSVVWLNSGTTLTYNNNYSFNNRDLSLKGEAYFEVKKNAKIPLVLTCNKLKVKVLGTEFNVSAYPEDQEIIIVLEKGVVELLRDSDKSFNYKLKPGEMAQYNELSNEITIKEINVNNYTAWKDGVLFFKDTPMKEVIKTLERRFNIDIVVKNSTVYDPAFNATFKDESLYEVLDFILFSCHIQYKIQKDSIKKMIVELY